MQSAEVTAPLYIRARHLLSIVLRGPALEISILHQSVQRFPLRRLRHITLLGQTDIDLNALLVAASKGLPVAWFDGRGNLLCQILPKQRADNQLSHRLEPIMYCTRAQVTLAQLTENFRLHACSQVGRTLGVMPARVCDLEEVLSRINRERGKGVHHTAAEWFEGVWHQQWLQLLHNVGINPISLLADKLTASARHISWAWRVSFLFNVLIQHREVACADTVARRYRVVEEHIDILLRRFLITLGDELERMDPWHA